MFSFFKYYAMVVQMDPYEITKPLIYRGFVFFLAVRTGMTSPPAGGSVGPFHPEGSDR